MASDPRWDDAVASDLTRTLQREPWRVALLLRDAAQELRDGILTADEARAIRRVLTRLTAAVLALGPQN
jgi:hypothetical protein